MLSKEGFIWWEIVKNVNYLIKKGIIGCEKETLREREREKVEKGVNEWEWIEKMEIIVATHTHFQFLVSAPTSQHLWHDSK